MLTYLTNFQARHSEHIEEKYVEKKQLRKTWNRLIARQYEKEIYLI